MLDPYRTPGPVDADLPAEPLPDRCAPPAVPACPGRSAASRTPRAPIPAGYAKALSAAATLLLLVGSASLSAMTWTVTRTLASASALYEHAAAAHSLQKVDLPVPPVPHKAKRAPAPHEDQDPMELAWPVRSILGSLGRPTHDPEVLWKRAEQLAEGTGSVTLARARVLPEALSSALEPIEGPRRWNGIRLLDTGAGGEPASFPRTPGRGQEPDPLGRMFGLSRGDRVTAINGYDVNRPQSALEAYATVRSRGVAVVELVRDRRLVALRVEAAR
jgi:hypothetical protein